LVASPPSGALLRLETYDTGTNPAYKGDRLVIHLTVTSNPLVVGVGFTPISSTRSGNKCHLTTAMGYYSTGHWALVAETIKVARKVHGRWHTVGIERYSGHDPGVDNIVYRYRRRDLVKTLDVNRNQLGKRNRVTVKQKIQDADQTSQIFHSLREKHRLTRSCRTI
jgi:hypothetical protein